MRIRVKKAGTSDVPVLVLVPADSTIKSLIRSCAEKLNIDRHSASLTLMCCGGAICDIQDLVDLDECEISVAPLPSAHLEAPRTPSPEVTRSKNILEDVEPDLDQRRSQIKKRKRSLSIEKSTPPPKKAHVPVGAAKKTSNTEPAKPPKSSVSPLVRAVSLFPHLISNLIRHSKYVQKLHGWNFDEVKQINQISDLNLRSSVIMRYLEARGWFIIPPRNEELMRMGYISFILDTLQVDRNPATETNTVSRASGAVEHRWTTASGRVDLLRMLAQAKFLSKPIRKAFNSSSAAYGSFLPEWVTSKHTEKLLDNKPVLEPLEVSIDKLISQSGQSIGEDLLLASFSKYHTRSTHKVVPVDETAMMALANEELEAQRTAEIMRTLFGDDKDQFINNHQHDSITSDVLSDSRESTASTEHQHSVVSEKSAKPRPSFAPVKPEILPRNDVVPTIPLPSVVSVRPANPPSNIPQPKPLPNFNKEEIDATRAQRSSVRSDSLLRLARSKLWITFPDGDNFKSFFGYIDYATYLFDLDLYKKHMIFDLGKHALGCNSPNTTPAGRADILKFLSQIGALTKPLQGDVKLAPVGFYYPENYGSELLGSLLGSSQHL